MRYTFQFVGRFPSQNAADEFASFVAGDNHLAIMAVRPSTSHEIRGFNPAYLQAALDPPAPEGTEG